MKIFPFAKTENIVVQNSESEILIYDLLTNKAFCLNKTLTDIYLACDGNTTFQEFKERNNFPDELIYFSLDELKREKLIQTSSEYQSPFLKLSRREIVRKIGFSTFLALPLITSIVAPAAINAASIAGPPGSPTPPTPCAAINQSCPHDGSFTQGTCCSGLRCLDTNSCFSCRTNGTSVYDFATDPSGCTPPVCNSNNLRNWCCSGNLTAVVTGANLCDCRCQ